MQEGLIKGKSEYEALQERIALLQEEIADLTAERDELKLRECPRIQGEYAAKLGCRVLELYRAKARLLQLKRAVEILQAARNRQEKKDAQEARQQAREEYREYEQKLEEEAQKIHEENEYRSREERRDAEWKERSGAGADSDAGEEETRSSQDKESYDKGPYDKGPQDTGTSEDTAEGQSSDSAGQEPPKFKSRGEELKYYHRKLVKMLHPDANPNRTKEEAELFLEVEKAFEEGDLDKLIEIYNMMIAKDAEIHLSDTPEDIERLREIVKTLEKKKKDLLDEIMAIKSGFPYTAKALLENEEEVAKILRRIEEEMEEINRQYQDLLARFNRLKEGKDPDGTE